MAVNQKTLIKQGTATRMRAPAIAKMKRHPNLIRDRLSSVPVIERVKRKVGTVMIVRVAKMSKVLSRVSRLFTSPTTPALP